MSMSEKEKVQLQAKRLKRLKYKATGLYLYHPATDSWIPAQCDDEGRLVIDPSDLDKRYLKLDGSSKMLGNLDLGAHNLIGDHNVFGIGDASHKIKIIRGINWDIAGAIRCAMAIGVIGDRGYYSTDCIRIVNYYGGAKTVLEAINGRCNIPLAGDITFVAEKKLFWTPDCEIYRASPNVIETPDVFNAGRFDCGAESGVSGSFTTVDGKTVTVTKGINTSIV